MRQVPDSEIEKRFAFDNPWWDTGEVEQRYREMPHRIYFHGFFKLLSNIKVNRAPVLMGPRRVGKSVMIQQAIQGLLNDGVLPRCIMYLSVDQPLYTGMGLESLLQVFQSLHNHQRSANLYVFFDEIQYLHDWERHLKSLVDSYPSIQFCVSGSAAAALKMQSKESGAGRFTDFLLPPLTFAEFLMFRNETEKCLVKDGERIGGVKDIDRLNREFEAYVNFGGFPEALFSPEIRDQMDRFVSHDIIDKVLLRDLPSLYGIADVQELKRLFNVLAYNTGMEVNLSELSQNSSIAKNTLRKYLDYLEAAFLISRLPRIDENARRLKRQSNFKVYLTNPCLRAAMFGRQSQDSDDFGLVAETAIISQFAQSAAYMTATYARWKTGEIDLAILDSRTQSPEYIYEVKWNDRIKESPKTVLKHILHFVRKLPVVPSIGIATKSISGDINVEGFKVLYRPAAYLAFTFSNVMIGMPLALGHHPKGEHLFDPEGWEHADNEID